MASYLITQEITITRQEGDTADIEFTVPDVLDITNATVIFQIRNAKNTILYNAAPVPVAQDITVPLLPATTKGYSGRHRWELQVNISGAIITIGKGDFVILPEQITAT